MKNEVVCMIWLEMISGFLNFNFCWNYGGVDMYCDYFYCYISLNKYMECCLVLKCGKFIFYYEL